MSARDELAEVLYVEDNWHREITEHDSDRRSDEEYRSRASNRWRGGNAGWSFRQKYPKRADAILAAGYSKPREIMTPSALEALPHGSAVQTSDESDTVVLKDGDTNFRNQSGYALSATDLWRYGTHPMTVIYEPEATR